MDAKVLAGLVAEVIKSGQRRTLTEKESLRFHAEFEDQVSHEVEQLRLERRKALEELKNIAVY